MNVTICFLQQFNPCETCISPLVWTALKPPPTKKNKRNPYETCFSPLVSPERSLDSPKTTHNKKNKTPPLPPKKNSRNNSTPKNSLQVASTFGHRPVIMLFTLERFAQRAKPAKGRWTVCGQCHGGWRKIGRSCHVPWWGGLIFSWRVGEHCVVGVWLGPCHPAF